MLNLSCCITDVVRGVMDALIDWVSLPNTNIHYTSLLYPSFIYFSITLPDEIILARVSIWHCLFLLPSNVVCLIA